MTQAKFIVFEGCDGCGKGTQIDATHHYLINRGIRNIVVADPGSTTTGLALRQMTKDGTTPEAELLMFLTARAALLEQKIIPALQEGTTVLCDRFTLSTLIYQGFGRNRFLPDLINQATLGILRTTPDLYVIIDVPDVTMLERRGARGEKEDVFERDTEFMRAIAAGYRHPSCFIRSPFKLIDGLNTVEYVQGDIRAALEPLFGI